MFFQGWDDNGQDPQGECEAGQRQVQDLEGGEERQHEKESGPVREHVSQGQEGWRHMPEFQKPLTVTNFDPHKNFFPWVIEWVNAVDMSDTSKSKAKQEIETAPKSFNLLNWTLRKLSSELLKGTAASQ